MRTARVISQLKDGLRNVLGPLLPLVRSIRTLPERRRVQKSASILQPATRISICYVTREFPKRPALRTEIAQGGEIKLTFLAEQFSHSYPRANLLYTVSSVGDVGKAEIVRTAKQNGLKIILNQNGVAFPAWHGPGWEAKNEKYRAVYQLADFIIYQSEFCKLSAQKFLGASNTPSMVLYNPVDLNLYKPHEKPVNRKGPVLLLGGNQYEQYRFDSAALAFQAVSKLFPESSLIVTGKLWGESQALAMEHARAFLRHLGVENRVEFTGPYSQQDAPKIFGRADMLIHTKFNDPSPNLISEALASGLPIVYSISGGTPELVGNEAGIGIVVEQSWEKNAVPDPCKMATAAAKIWEKLEHYRKKARDRAEQTFSLDSYVQKHADIFKSMTEQEQS